MTTEQNCDKFRTIKNSARHEKILLHNEVDGTSSKNARLAFLKSHYVSWTGPELGVLLLQPSEYWFPGMCLKW